MIQKYMLWRLWNQMFQYATLRAFQIKNNLDNDKLRLDFSYAYKMQSKNWDGWYDQLMYFNTIDYEIWKISPNFIQRFFVFCDNLLKLVLLVYNTIFIKDKTKRTYSKTMYKIQKKFQKLYNKNWLYLFRLWYCNFKNSKIKNKVFYWTFESQKYFDDIKDTIQKEFTPKYDILAHNTELYKNIQDSESVCITIRRWDFVENQQYKSHYYVCTPDYFYRWIKYIQSKIPNAKFFVFSDDVERCKNNMKFPKWTQFERWWDPIREKLRLMYSCKHFIISNSTFSRWAQYLSRNPNKIVCAPTKWCNDDFYTDNYELYEKSWVLIKP